MTDIELKRQWVSGMYSSLKWRKKVKKMSDSQVVAIYLREHGKERPSGKPPKEDKQDDIPF